MHTFVAKAAAESIFSCAIKNSVCYLALDKIRSDLQSVITEVARPRIGNFLAPIVGNQLGLMAAVPVSLMYGELMTKALKTMVQLVYSTYLRIFYGIRQLSHTSLIRQVFQQVMSFAAGFFAKTYFCNYGMPYVASALRTALAISAPFTGITLPYFFLISPFVITMTPAITFVVGDIIAFGVSKCTYSLLDHSCTVLFDKSHPLPKRMLL